MRNEVSTGLQMPVVWSAAVQIAASGGADGNAPGALLGKVIQHQQLAANPFTRNNVPMHIPCKCPDGSAGLAQFAGFRCVK